MGVDIFFSLMRSYFCLFVAALRPCQGREPRLKYMRTYPSDSRSSRLDCSVDTRAAMSHEQPGDQQVKGRADKIAQDLPIPKCVFIEA